MRLRSWNIDLFLQLTFLLVCLSSQSLAQFQSNSIEFSAFNNTNIGLARTDHMNDYGVQVRLGGQSYFEQTTGSGIFVSSDIALTRYDIYSNLDRIEVSGQIGYAKKLGIGFDQPRLSASINLQYRDSESAIRSGWSVSPILGYSKNISDRTSVNASITYYQFEADNRIDVAVGTAGWLDSEDNPTSIQNSQIHAGGEWAWTPNTYLALGATYISGEFSSMALPTSGLSAYASAVSQDDVCGNAYYNYRYSGQGEVVSAVITHIFSTDSELSLSFQRTLVDADSGKGYGQNISNLSYSRRF
jgi:hypothetical protein